MSNQDSNRIGENDIAVVGMALRFPDATTIEEYWRNLVQARESVRFFDDETLRNRGVRAVDLEHPDYVKAGVMLDDVEKWDAGFFGFNPKDAAIMDPQHRIFLEVAWEALESSGYPPEHHEGPIGVFAGCGMNAYFMFHVLTNPKLVQDVGLFLLRHTGNDKDFLATRVSYEFDLKGPSINVQTACSTSLVAVHLATQSLLSGECDLALAGGVTVELPMGRGYRYEQGEILSKDGHCRAFDASSTGTIFGSGGGAVILKRAKEAWEDGDTIHAIVKGTAINNDGAGKVGYLAPSVDGQAAAIAEAMAVGDVEPRSVTYVESHGTGTALGDPIEIAALTQAFRTGTEDNNFCGIGSVKSNIGHLDTAAGIASFIKASLALKHRQLPPSLGFETPNPECNFEQSPFYVNHTLKPWDTDRAPRRAGISSLGVGGTNAHVILEEAPERTASSPSRKWQLLPVSGRSSFACEQAHANLVDYLGDNPNVPLADVAWTLEVGRRAMSHRAVAVVQDAADAARVIESKEPTRLVQGQPGNAKPDVVFMFPGGGAQYPNVAKDLYGSEPVFTDALKACFKWLDGKLEASLESLLFPVAGEEEHAKQTLEQPKYSILAVFSVSYALAKQWMHWGIVPAAMTGHSLGEYVAATIAEVLSLDDALKIVLKRGDVFEKMPAGGMLSVPVDEATLLPYLDDELSIAVINAPELCVASGTVEALDRLSEKLAADGIEARRVPISVAAHSPMLDPFLAEFKATLETLRFSEPKIPFVSNRSGQWITAEEAMSPDYWVNHLRQSVRFADGLSVLLEQDDRVLLEVGPGKILGSLTKQHSASNKTHQIFSSVRHEDEEADDHAYLMGVLGQLWCAGVEIDWKKIHADETRYRVPLPTYPFERQPYWIEPGEQATGGSTHGDGRREDVGQWFTQPVWLAKQPAKADLETGATISILHQGHALVNPLKSQLEEAGFQVMMVEQGQPFEANAANLTVRTDNAEDCAKLWSHWQRYGMPNAVIDLSSAMPSSTKQAVDPQHAWPSRFKHAFTLAQTLAKDEPEQPLRWLTVTQQVEQVGGERIGDEAQALAGAVMRVAAVECAKLESRIVDVEQEQQPEQMATQLVQEVKSPAEDRPVAWRGAQRFERGFTARPLAPVSDAALEASSIAITGGLGGIGLSIASMLAKQGPHQFLLMSRRGLPPREEWEQYLERGDDSRAIRQIRAIQDIESAGSAVKVEAVDVTRTEAIREAVQAFEAEGNTLTGVIHAAGVLDDALLPEKSLEDAMRVLSPKVQGLQALEQALEDRDLKFFHVFSSTSALACAAGQVDYSAANAYCDAWARKRTAEGKPAMAIAWGAWRDLGMAAEIASGEREPGAAVIPFRTPADHPLLDSIAKQDQGKVHFKTEFATEKHWLVDEHRVKEGTALIPGAGFLELLRAAYEAHESHSQVVIQDVDFLSPFVVPDDITRVLEISLEPTESGYAASVKSKVPNPDGTLRDEEHVFGKLRKLASPIEAESLAEVKARVSAEQETFTEAPKQAHLKFGPRWDNLRERHRAGQESLLTLRLGDAFTGDLDQYKLHPALLDVGTAGAQALIPDFDAESMFYVPIGVGELKMNQPLTANMYAHIRYRAEPSAGGEFAEFDITFYDDQGQVLVVVDRFTMKKIEGQATLSAGSELTEQPASGSAELAEMLEDAIRPIEGAEAWLRLLEHADGAHWIATPFPIESTLAQLRRVATTASTQQALPDIDVSQAREALINHPAVEEAEILPRMPRPGQIRLVAYIVRNEDVDATVSELRRHVKGMVSKDQVPASFEDVDEIPRDAEGNVLADELPDPFADDESFVAPRTPAEKIVGQIWKEILGVEAVSVYDNFFDIGGHSLLSMRVVNKVDKKTGVRLNQAIMVLQTLEQISAEVEKQGGAPSETDAQETAQPEVQAESKQETGSEEKGLFNRLKRSVFKG